MTLPAHPYLHALTNRVLVYDGAMGTNIQRHNPTADDFGGKALDKKRDLDAEAIALAEGNFTRGTVLIGFERNHRIGRFPVVNGELQNPVGYVKLPPEAKRMRQNKGLEAVTVMQGGPYKGSVIAFSERFPDNTAQHTGWLWVKGEPQRLGFPDIGGFEVTDIGLEQIPAFVKERSVEYLNAAKALGMVK